MPRRAQGVVDLPTSPASTPVAAAGTARLRCDGSDLLLSVNGQAYAALGEAVWVRDAGAGEVSPKVATDEVKIGTVANLNLLRLASTVANEPDAIAALANIPNSDATPNQVMTVGHNRAGSGGRQDNSEHSWHIALEREFLSGVVRQCEAYIQYVSADGLSTIRPFGTHVDIATDQAFIGFRGEQLDAIESDGSHQFWVMSKQGQSTVLSTNSAAFLGVHHDDGTETMPSAGALRMTKDCNIVGARAGVSQVFTQLTASPNMILGSTGNTCGMFIDAGPGVAVNIRPRAAAVTYSLDTTRFTCPAPLRLPTYTVATLPAGAVQDMVYCSNGDAGSPCLAVHDGTNWKVVAFGATVSP